MRLTLGAPLRGLRHLTLSVVMPPVKMRPLGVPLASGFEDLAEDEGAVGHQAVDTEVEEAVHLGAIVDRPHVDLEAEAM